MLGNIENSCFTKGLPLNSEEFFRWESKLSELNNVDTSHYFSLLCQVISELLECDLVLMVKSQDDTTKVKIDGNTRKSLLEILPKDLIHIVFHNRETRIDKLTEVHQLVMRHLDKNPAAGNYLFYSFQTIHKQDFQIFAASLSEQKSAFLKEQFCYLVPLICQSILRGFPESKPAPPEIKSDETEIQKEKQPDDTAGLVENLPIGIVKLNKNGYIGYANTWATRFLDAEGQILKGTHIGRFLAQTSIPQRVLNALRSNSKSDFVVNVITKSNRTKQASVTSLMAGEEEGAILVVQDVEDKLELTRQLKQKENDLLRLVNNKSLIIVRTDSNSNIVYANKTFLINTGFMEEGVLGKSLESFLSKSGKYGFTDLWSKIIHHDISQAELFIKSNDNTQTCWLAYIQITGEEVVFSGVNITELRKTQAILEGQQKLLGDIFENMPGMVMVINRNFEVVFTNQDEITETHNKPGSCHEVCLGSHELCPDCQLHTVFNDKVPKQLEISDEKNDRTYLVNTVPLLNSAGQVMYAIEFFHDITAQKKIQVSMQEARNVAEKASKLKSSFLSNINHEIRTPLNAIMGFSKLMVMKCGESDVHKEYLNVIHSSGQRLLDTISGLIELSRLQSGDYVVANEVFNLNKLLVSIGDSYKEHKNVFVGNVQFNMSLPTNQLWINTDKVRLTQVIVQLLDNAIKFTNKGVVFMGLEIRSGNIAIIVQDNGQGIRPENPSEIFEYFGKDHLKSHPMEGAGLGLAIAYHNAKAIGGNLELIPGTQQGSRFEIHLSHEFTQTAPKEPTPAVEWKKCNVLIAEDDNTNFLYLQELLANTGLVISRASNGKETLEIIDNSIDLLLLDIQMPIVDGIKVARTIRERGMKIPIIALTAHNYREKECLEAGCNQFITKPINSNLLFSVLRHYLA